MTDPETAARLAALESAVGALTARLNAQQRMTDAHFGRLVDVAILALSPVEPAEPGDGTALGPVEHVELTVTRAERDG